MTDSHNYWENKNRSVYTLELPNNKKVYFASDLHLGLYPYNKSAHRERLFVQWLSEIKDSTGALFLVGDVFDFWYEYKKVVSKGFVRFLGKLCEFTDAGIPVYIFTGNHDVWMFNYLQSEIGATVFTDPVEFKINDKIFFIGHGDGVGPGDMGYKMLKGIFTSKVCQFLFSRIHPNFAYALGQTWSKHSRYSKGIADEFHGIDKEYNILFAKELLKTRYFDYFIFGHRHIPMDIRINETTKLFNLGEWIVGNTYLEFDGHSAELKSYFPVKEVHIVRV
jgi:UDP-2,3-diacylglucosamine hydrolase